MLLHIQKLKKLTWSQSIVGVSTREGGSLIPSQHHTDPKPPLNPCTYPNPGTAPKLGKTLEHALHVDISHKLKPFWTNLERKQYVVH